MPIAVTDRITRGTNNTAEFAVAFESDLKLSRVMVADLAARNAIPEWKRLPFMIVELVSGEVYQLGADTTIAGQSWTEITPALVPDNVVTEDEIFDVDGYIQSDLIRNIFLNEQFVVDSEVEMLALTTVTGNFVIRTDTGGIFVKLNNDDPATLADFSEITYPGAVLSVNGLTGSVVISLDDLITAETTVFNDAVAASPDIIDINSAIFTLTTDLDALEVIVDNIIASSGTIVGSTGSVDNVILRSDGTGGTTLQPSVITINDSGNLGLGITGVTTGSSRVIQARGSEPDVSLIFLSQGTGSVGFNSGGSIVFSGLNTLFSSDIVNFLNSETAGSAELRIFEEGPDSGNYIGLTVPDTLSASVTYTLPNAPSTNGRVLKGNTDGTLFWAVEAGGGGGGGTGDVVGPSTSVDNRVVFFDGTTGKLIKDSGLTLSGSNTGDQTITLTGDITGSGTSGITTTIANGAVDIAMLSAAGTASSSTYLRGDNTWATISGLGDVIGPGSATDNAVARFDGTTGKLVQNSLVTISDSTGDITIPDSAYVVNTSANAGLLLNNNEALVYGGSGQLIVNNLGIEVAATVAFGGGLKFTNDTTLTNTVSNLRIEHSTSGTPAAGIGAGVVFQVETSAGNIEPGSSIETIATDVTAASEDFDLLFKLMNAGAIATERLRIKSTGQLQLNGYTATNSYTGTPVGYLQFDVTGNIITASLPADKEYVDNIYTASNGIIKTSTNFTLGGTITNVDLLVNPAGGQFTILDSTGLAGIAMVSDGTNTVSTIIGSSSSDTIELYIDPGNINGNGPGAFLSDSTSVPKGLQYSSNYSINYTDRSLTDKGYVLGPKTYTGKQNLGAPSTLIAGVNLARSGDPVLGLEDGDIWYNSAANKFRGRQNGINLDLIGSGGTGIIRTVINRSTSTTAGATSLTDYVYNCTSTFTLTLPTAVGNTNRYTIKNSGTGVITVNTTSSQTIDGGLTAVISTQYASIDIVSDGTNWIII